MKDGLFGTPTNVIHLMSTVQSLGVAAGILSRGTAALSKASSREEREFHKALSQLRQRWKVRRAHNGTIVGDLSYYSGKRPRTLLFLEGERERVKHVLPLSL